MNEIRNKKKTIFITLSRGTLVRNFVHSGVVSNLLDSNFSVVILTPNSNNKEIFQDYIHDDLYIEPLHQSKLKGTKIFGEILKGAVFNQTVNTRYKLRHGGKKPNKSYYLFRIIFFAPLSFYPFLKKIIRNIESKINKQQEHDYLFEKYHPDLVLITASNHAADIGVLKSAKRYKVPTILMPISWDSLSKFLYPGKAEFMFVWSPFMKEQAIKYQGYRDSEISMVGVPQFDFYKKNDLLWSREEFCEILKLEPEKKIIFYGSAGGNLCDEPKYVELISKWIEKGELKNAQILIRSHMGYKGDLERFEDLEKINNCVLDRTAKPDLNFKDRWDSSMYQIKILFNSLYHADVCINMASTLSLDSIACGTPVININFELDEEVDPNYAVKRLYLFDYIEPVINSGGVWVVKSREELLRAIKETVYEGQRNKEGEERLIKNFIYKKDGQAAKRISKRIKEIIENI